MSRWSNVHAAIASAFVSTKSAVSKNDRLWPSKECANHHKDGAGCHHGCTCHG
ncbi:hypothetical protein [Pseudorhodoplanes sp.]|uniref:hypothetical protein n=1 Tax=Pseudorhodoplanes sp. TaxID=1934341 RepID=UPI00391D81FE